ncbi:MAG: DMT family transporter [Hyphomicrobiales bacterium]|nr:DMT family transporter [Hyphomicrobiales bacterium]MCP4998972.1 DMT family transporter [Hyphomicrobiales bacterium]
MNRIENATVPDLLLVVLAALIWGSAFTAIKVAVPETGPYWLAATRVTIGFLVLLPYAIWRGFILPTSSSVWFLLVMMSLLNVVLPFLLISWAELSIDAGVTSLLMGTAPFFALIGSHLFTTDDRLTRTKTLGVLLGFCGVLTIVGFDAFAGLGRSNLMAQIACFLGSMSYVAGGLLVRKIDIPPGRLACLALGISSLALIGIALLADGLPSLDISANATVALLYLGLLPTGFAYLLRYYLIRKIGYSTFAIGLNLIPVFGIVLGVWLLGEALSVRILLALALVVCGLFVTRLGPKPLQTGTTVND